MDLPFKTCKKPYEYKIEPTIIKCPLRFVFKSLDFPMKMGENQFIQKHADHVNNNMWSENLFELALQQRCNVYRYDLERYNDAKSRLLVNRQQLIRSMFA